MKVYTVWEGSYSDRKMTAVFSSYELADKFIQARKVVDFFEVDDKPIEFEIDKIIVNDEPTVIYLDSWLEPVKSIHPHMLDSRNDVERDPDDGMYRVKVDFYADAEKMLKIARDKVCAFQAREDGI